MDLRMLFGCILWLSTWSLSSAADPDRHFTLEEMCLEGSSREPVAFKNVNEVRDLLKTFIDTPYVCPKHFHKSILELRKVLTTDNLQDVCSDKIYMAIKDYHEKFMSDYAPGASRDKIKAKSDAGRVSIPESLANFFIVFVLKVSGLCKQSLIRKFNTEVKKLDQVSVSEDGLRILENLSERGYRVAGRRFHKQPKKLEDVWALNKPIPEEGKLHLVVKDSDHIVNKAHQVCKTRFMPVYEEIFLPVVRLNNLGYWENYITRADNMELGQDESYRRWYTIVEICEQFKAVKILIADKKLTEGSQNAEKIDVVTADEFKKLAAEVKDGGDNATGYMPERVYFTHDIVSFGFSLWSISLKEQRAAVSELKSFRKKSINFEKIKLGTLKDKIVSPTSKLEKQFRNRSNQTNAVNLSLWYCKNRDQFEFSLLIPALLSFLA